MRRLKTINYDDLSSTQIVNSAYANQQLLKEDVLFAPFFMQNTKNLKCFKSS